MSTARDKAVLNTILNPFLPEDGYDECNSTNSTDDIGEITNEVLEAQRLEKQAILMIENNNVKDGIEILGKAIQIAPNLPSLYNNRAQAYRLNNDIKSALDDLNKTILLSKGCGRSARQAYCQRGLIYKKMGENEKAIDDIKNAAKLGSQFAKMFLVQLNPYAALCNTMLSQVMEKLYNGESIEENKA